MFPDRRVLMQWIKPEPTEHEMECMGLLRVGDYEIYSAKVREILAEGKESFIKMGVTGMIRGGDLVVGLFTASGDLAFCSTGTHLHIVTAQLPVKYLVKNYLNDPIMDIREGDIFYANDAYYGGIHNPDQFAIMPIFSRGDVVGWACSGSHQAEIGATTPGSMPITAKTKYDEGFRVPPIRIGRDYQLSPDMVEMFTNACRAPRAQDLDMRARVVGVDRIRSRIQELCQQMGNDFLAGLLRRMIVIGEQAARSRFSEFLDGTYQAITFGDGAAAEDGLIRVCTTFRKLGDSITIDTTGSSPETPSSYNSLPHQILAFVSIPLFNLIFSDMPHNAGVMAPIDVEFPPEGSLFNPGPEAAISNTVFIGNNIMANAYACLSKLAFACGRKEWVQAPTASSWGVIVSGRSNDGQRFVDFLTYGQNTVGQGARSDKDGENAYGFTYTPEGRGGDLDEIETLEPHLLLFQQHAKDGCGFGKYRSGVGTAQAYVVYRASDFSYQVVARESKLHPSSGLFGGYPPSPAFGAEIKKTNLLDKMQRGDKDIPTDLRELITRKAIEGELWIGPHIRPLRKMQNGDVFVAIRTGAGGYGDVLDREPDLVMQDLRNQIISHWTAKNVFKVAYDHEKMQVDYEGTQKLRDEERKARLKRGKPYDEFEKDWQKRKPPKEVLKFYGSWPDAKNLE
ncbi:hydantoinase B/oxoprolinase family protein [Chloroflexota bacterium]